MPRLVLAPILLILVFGSLIVAMAIGLRPMADGASSNEQPSNMTSVLMGVSALVLGTGVALFLSPVCKIGMLRLWGGRARICWVSAGSRLGYADATDHRLYLLQLEYWAATFLPLFVTLGVIYGMLISRNLLLVIPAIAAAPLRVATLVFPLINLAGTLRYPRHSLFCEASCGGYEIYAPILDQG